MRHVLENYHTAAGRPAVDDDAGMCKDGAAGGIVRILQAGADGAGPEVGCRAGLIEAVGYPGGIKVVGCPGDIYIVGYPYDEAVVCEVLKEHNTVRKTIKRMNGGLGIQSLHYASEEGCCQYESDFVYPVDFAQRLEGRLG